MKLTAYIMPVVVCGLVIYGIIKKVKVFDCFSQGAVQGLETAVSLLPVLVGLMLGVSMFVASGGAQVLSNLLSPVFSLIGVPEEVIPLCILSPVSGSGSLSVYEQLLSTYGADSYAGRIASVISGATETTFYAVTVYLGSVGIKKSRNVIPCALAGDFASFAAAAFTVRLFFGT